MNMFDERASEWDSDPSKVERARILSKLISKALNNSPFEKAMEYGCGTGLLSFALKDEFDSIDLVDTSPGMLAVLQLKIEASEILNMHPYLLDLLAKKDIPAHYGIIYSLLTLHHIPQTQQIMQKFYDILQPGGMLCISDLDTEDGTFHPADTKDIHFGFDRNELSDIAKKAGFEKITFCNAMNITKMAAGMEKTFPLFMMTARKPL
ncbi:MAG: class I SAM-dependent methyltransferase [Chloroflexota bacterium]